MVVYVLQCNRGGGIETILEIRPAQRAGSWIYIHKKHGVIVNQAEYDSNPFLKSPEEIIEWVCEKFPELANLKFWVHVRDDMFHTTNLIVHEPQLDEDDWDDDV